MTDAYINPEGKAVNVLGDPQKGIAEDPIDLKVFAARGEPLQFALISDDDRWRAFTQIVPFPLEKTSGPCHLSLLEKGPYYQFVSIEVSGFQPGETVRIDVKSEGQGGKSQAQADEQGFYTALISPVVRGMASGHARIMIAAKSCRIGAEFPWGAGSQIDQ